MTIDNLTQFASVVFGFHKNEAIWNSTVIVDKIIQLETELAKV